MDRMRVESRWLWVAVRVALYGGTSLFCIGVIALVLFLLFGSIGRVSVQDGSIQACFL